MATAPVGFAIAGRLTCANRRNLSIASISRPSPAAVFNLPAVIPCKSSRNSSMRSSHMAGQIVMSATTEASTVKIIIQGRNVDLTEALKAYVEDKVKAAVSNYEAGVKQVDVRLSVRGGDRGAGAKEQRTELTIYTVRNGVVRAEDSEDSMYASIDLVCDKVRSKLRKVKEVAINKGKWAGRGGPKGGQIIAEFLPDTGETEALPTEGEAKFPLEIVRTKYFFLAPMTHEEALEQVEQVGHDFYVFRDKKTDAIQVLYKRRQHGYGLLIPEKQT